MQLIKCKAHTGVVGNELADETAKKAAKWNCRSHDLTCADVSPYPYGNGMYWVAEANKGSEAGTPVDQDEREDPYYLSNLRKDLDKRVKASCCTGAAASSPGFYAQAWEKASTSALGDISNAFASRMPLAQRRTVWKTRAGLLMNAKLEQRWFKRGDGNCPLCGQPDSCTHIASGCPKLSGLYTERHNRAARILLKAILKGSLGASIHQADVGCADKMARSGLNPTDLNRRVARDLLPDDVANDPKAYEALSRPDATLLCDNPPRMEIVEVKICRDTDCSVQLERAEKQHTALVGHLRRKFLNPVNLATFAFGATGTIYSDNLEQLVKLGVDRTSARKTLHKIHASLVNDLHTIVCTRRAQEHSSATPTTGSMPTHRTHKGRNR